MKKYKQGMLRVSPVLGLLAVAPLTSYAAFNYCDPRGGLYNILCKIHEILSAVLPVLVALGVVYFVWGVITYVIAGDDEAKTKGRDRIIFGIIGLAVIVSVWGLVYLLTDTFDTRYDAPLNEDFKGLIPSRS